MVPKLKKSLQSNSSETFKISKSTQKRKSNLSQYHINQIKLRTTFPLDTYLNQIKKILKM